MKIQIDTKAKTIKVDEVVSLKEFFSMVKKLLPEDWQEYKLETNTVINNWVNPIVVDRWHLDPYPWWRKYEIYCGSGTQSGTTTSIGGGISSTTDTVYIDDVRSTAGIYNIEA